MEKGVWMTNATIRETAGMAEGRVKRYFRLLTERGALEAYGEKRG
jgi:hypothetical protein